MNRSELEAQAVQVLLKLTDEECTALMRFVMSKHLIPKQDVQACEDMLTHHRFAELHSALDAYESR